MRIDRPIPRRRSGLPVVGCGCLFAFTAALVLLAIAFVLLLPVLPQVIAPVLGFTPRGDATSALAAAPAPQPTVQLVEAAPLMSDLTIDLAGQRTVSVNPASIPYEASIGSESITGARTAVITMTEESLMDVCRQRTPFCGADNPQFRNASIDLKPGAVIVYADVSLPELNAINQRVGALLRLTRGGRGFEFVGVVLNGQLFDPPERFRAQIEELETRGNEVMRGLVVQTGSGQYQLDYVQIDETTITAVLR